MRLWRNLTNTQQHAPIEMQARWLGPILGVVKHDPVLDYVTFDGSGPVDLTGDGVPDACGNQWEAALWMGRADPTARYVEWAIRYGIGLGMRPSSPTVTASTAA